MNEEEIIAADTASISILSMTDKRVSLQNIRKTDSCRDHRLSVERKNQSESVFQY